MSKGEATLAFNSHVIEQLGTTNLPTDPATFQEAMDSPFRNQWIQSIREELSSLHENETWGKDIRVRVSSCHRIKIGLQDKTESRWHGTI